MDRKKINEKDYKSILLQVLVNFDSFCRKHNISYSLAYGSMLGAIRHKGFIPWDDDIDIFMLREEYDKFVKLWNESSNLLKDNYELWGIDDEKNFFYGHLVKFFDKNTLLIEKTKNHIIEYGIYIDIFILEDISSDSKKADKQQKKYKFYRKLLSHFFKHASILNFLAKKISIKIPSIYFFINKLKNITKQEKSESVSVYEPIDKIIYKRKDFKNIIYLPFEEYMFPVSAQYDFLLKQQYGNYMSFPPENERKGHNIEVYTNE
ncbi:LicD family protein [Gallibacterium genomosp. 1]|uniref:LicD/FKTN/FKRP nucleotidyltransferase domain-containing protein n=1 Tax=Gallibacterium genomosp. 1 TaxID=155515 RepID=A0A0A2Y468_9PAST|nr:LicD family protein [Gallibacterium genomosp. 1]KGQ37405.1 hypothetical protein JP36_06535 [Gallibacterium genomosp. 1]